MKAKLARWVLFSIIFALIPLFVDFIAELTRTNGQSASFGRHGELYLLASAMCAVGVGEILGVNQKFVIAKIAAGGAALLIIGLATALYTISASDAAAELVKQAGDAKTSGADFYKGVVGYSWLMFVFSCIVSTSCIALSEVE